MGLRTRLEVREEYRALEASLAASRSANARLRLEVRRLTEDPTAIESLARGELGFIRPGEKLFILTDVHPAGRR
jgi:cell division protein FtsB